MFRTECSLFLILIILLLNSMSWSERYVTIPYFIREANEVLGTYCHIWNPVVFIVTCCAYCLLWIKYTKFNFCIFSVSLMKQRFYSHSPARSIACCIPPLLKLNCIMYDEIFHTVDAVDLTLQWAILNVCKTGSLFHFMSWGSDRFLGSWYRVHTELVISEKIVSFSCE